MIPIRIKTTGTVDLSDELYAYLKKKAAHLEKLTDVSETTALFEFELEALSAHTSDSYRAEFNFSSRGKVLRCEGTGRTLHAAIDGMIGEAARRLTHLKGKHADIIRRGAKKIKDLFRDLRN